MWLEKPQKSNLCNASAIKEEGGGGIDLHIKKNFFEL